MICRYLRILLVLACIGPAASAMAECWVSTLDGGVLEFSIVGYDSPDPDAFQLLGHFDSYNGSLCLGDGVSQDSTMRVSVDMGNVAVAQQQVTDLLQGEDFFDTAHWPTASLQASSIEPLGSSSEKNLLLDKSDANFNVKAKLTMHGITHEVAFPVVITRIYSKSAKGETVALSAILDGTLSIKRLDYGIGQHLWAKTDYLADTVNIHFNVHLKPATADAGPDPKIGNR
jgi:polyisoprenoid-binding protein YceI